MKLKQRFLSMSLQRKIQIMFLFVMAACILFCFFIFYYVLETKMETSAIETENNNRVAISKNLDSTLENINTISRMVMLRDKVQNYLQTDTVTSDIAHQATQDIRDVINTYDISCSVIVFRKDQRNINAGPGITYINSRIIFDSDWLVDVRVKNGGYVVKYNGQDAFASNTGDFVTLARIIYDPDTQKEQGLLAINVPLRVLEQCITGYEDRNTHIALYGSEQEMITTNSPEYFRDKQYATKSFHDTQKGLLREEVLIVEPMDNTNFTLVIASEVALFDGLSIEMLVALLGCVIILLLFLAQINRYIAKHVTQPIHKLVDSMSEIQHGWFHRVSMNLQNDEIGQLKNSYNAMLIEINQLIDQLIQKEKNLQRAEMDALQEQIKPHFLYNTLDMIRFLALEQETEKVYTLLETLGNFYRKFLSKGQTDIPLGEEIEIVRNYLTLQKNRYEDVFDDEYDVEDGLQNILVPRLILQPLVENSIYHGVRLKGEKGTIRIKVYRNEDTLFLSIYDDGVGMSEEQKKLLFEGKDEKSFGFKGTIERIRYYYKTDDVFEIRSEEGEYCEIILKLPLKEETQDV